MKNIASRHAIATVRDGNKCEDEAFNCVLEMLQMGVTLLKSMGDDRWLVMTSLRF